ncbi:toxin co-regulated pilus biosynthesis Q family protein [Cupriavidus sp. BIC8F]|uniref:toxin co-regulated pilus biosynthesis Q family protein n=1 Tax=Cupriavidus sp. BIC8F TaxID=3079014 RepID=UPI002915F702|nr:toxin co-regulated pilus biosynthesis Q family protein [Cupriavidus sp. BIC8F]
MRQSNRTLRIAGAIASLVTGLCVTPAANASKAPSAHPAQQLSSDGWQSLQPDRTGKAAGGEAALLSAVSPIRTTVTGGAVLGSGDTSTAAAAVAPVTQEFRLLKGEPLQQQLQGWATRAGWTVAWNVPDGWIVPGDKAYGSDFETAVKRVVEELASNGADVVGDSWRGNRTVIISQNGMVQ